MLHFAKEDLLCHLSSFFSLVFFFFFCINWKTTREFFYCHRVAANSIWAASNFAYTTFFVPDIYWNFPLRRFDFWIAGSQDEFHRIFLYQLETCNIMVLYNCRNDSPSIHSKNEYIKISGITQKIKRTYFGFSKSFKLKAYGDSTNVPFVGSTPYCILTDTQTTPNPQLNGLHIRLSLNSVGLIFVSILSCNYFTIIKHRWERLSVLKTYFQPKVVDATITFEIASKWPVNLISY